MNENIKENKNKEKRIELIIKIQTQIIFIAQTKINWNENGNIKKVETKLHELTIFFQDKQMSFSAT